jgi:hypothetical protein
VVEHILSTHGALGPMPSTVRKKEMVALFIIYACSPPQSVLQGNHYKSCSLNSQRNEK